MSTIVLVIHLTRQTEIPHDWIRCHKGSPRGVFFRAGREYGEAGGRMTDDQQVETTSPARDSDRHLLARTRLRDAAAFERLFQRYYHPVYRIVYRLLGDEDAASDVTQETFVTLYTHPPQLQLDDEEIRAWLYRVALNRGYNALRSARR